MSLNLTLRDSLGQIYTLDTYMINFNRLRPGEVKKIKVVLKGVSGFTTEDILLQCVRHPTAQIGLPENTYEVATLGLSESGTYYDVLNVGSKGPDVETDIWIKWAMPPESLPGGAQFAINGTGKVIWT